MSTEAVDKQQQEMRNFMGLLPLTLAIAGLPDTEPGRHLSDGQMEVRATIVRNAYKMAKKVLRDIARDSSHPSAPGT
jgi:hypothetical protein